MAESIGQDENVWSDEWDQLTPESEIRMWDFYGLRHWIAKFIPRKGKTIEAGCGLGRYVFYFSEMGINIEGVDFSQPTIDYLNEWKLKNRYDAVFKKGNILNLEYPDNSLSGYISLGVIEHFIEGPQNALAEAYRVLRPGGIAIISTPSVSFYILYQKIRKKVKNIVKRTLFRKVITEKFYQYWYRPGKLKKFIEGSGLHITRYGSADLLFAFCEAGNYTEKYIKEGTFGYKFSNKHENGILNFIGAQSITVSVKAAEKMFCFFCGELKSNQESLSRFDVPVCSECECRDESKYYKKDSVARYCAPYIINPPVKKGEKFICNFCGKDSESSDIFEDYGFEKKVCSACLKIPEINIKLSNESVKPVWRKRMERNA
ncbi:MAG: class I SAM-dependent methyltransferase [Ignavibacteriae bacterium]|nr:class I SAM-dependent methyltransferase [Ignavibacteriota bacterium]